MTNEYWELNEGAWQDEVTQAEWDDYEADLAESDPWA